MPVTLFPDRLIRDNDSSLGAKIFDSSKAKAEAMVSPDRIADDLESEPIAGVTKDMALHTTSFRVRAEVECRFAYYIGIDVQLRR